MSFPNTPETNFNQYESHGLTAVDPRLKQFAPFVIRVEVPLIFSPTPKKRGYFQNAYRDRGAYAQARANVQNLAERDEVRKIGNPSIVELENALDIKAQLDAQVSREPLVLLLPPQSLSIQRTKLQQYSDKTRQGYVFQAWGEDQPKLSISGKCAAFYSRERGLQWASRKNSEAWSNFHTLMQYYFNNGYIYDTVGGSNAHHMVGSLSIHYDQWIYHGHIESFGYTLDDQHPHGGFDFNFEFTASQIVDTGSLITSINYPGIPQGIAREASSPLPEINQRNDTSRFRRTTTPRQTVEVGQASPFGQQRLL